MYLLKTSCAFSIVLRAIKAWITMQYSQKQGFYTHLINLKKYEQVYCTLLWDGYSNSQ